MIGSIRRECLDHIIIGNERGLRRVLHAYVTYSLRFRTHLSLDKDAPFTRGVALLADGKMVAVPHLAGTTTTHDARRRTHSPSSASSPLSRRDSCSLPPTTCVGSTTIGGISLRFASASDANLECVHVTTMLQVGRIEFLVGDRRGEQRAVPLSRQPTFGCKRQYQA